MSAIDVQNAKQIRDPMDVLITMELQDDATRPTYSDYSSTAKVADGALNDSGWPMRVIADLQGDGFALDGSVVLYDATTTASAANGKIGIRGNIGQAVNFSVSANAMISALSIYVTNAETVTYNGQTTAVAGGMAVVPINARSASLTIPAAEDDARVEVSLAAPRVVFVINNENLIKCTVSLRSDTSILSPTLPESEISIEAYNDADISEVAMIPEGVPITYRAGYGDDLSETRLFYLQGEVGWKDNVVTISGVDATYKMDKDTPATIAFNASDKNSFYFTGVSASRLIGVYNAFYAMAEDCGIDFSNVDGAPPLDNPAPKNLDRNRHDAIIGGKSWREVVAELNNLFHIEFPESFLSGYDFWLTYVDAGIPTLRWKRPTAKWDIYEEDCGDMQTTPEKKITGLKVGHHELYLTGVGVNVFQREDLGTGTWIYGDGMLLDISNDSIAYLEDFYPGDGPGTQTGGWTGQITSKRITSPSGAAAAGYPGKAFSGANNVTSIFYLIGDVPQGTIKMLNGYEVYTQVAPWGDGTYDSAARWAALFGNSRSNQSIALRGLAYAGTLSTKHYGIRAEETEAPEPAIQGRIVSRGKPASTAREIYPRLAYESLLKRSNLKGSFLWKGDPRIQPRDVVRFHRLDGSVEEITLESITITHEGGGTSAEITYRKGVV